MIQKSANLQPDRDHHPAVIPVWDLPTRLFHWALVALVVICFVTAKTGGNAMQYHEWSGVTILVLLIFRLIWGFVGSRPSRFGDFLKGPATVWQYATGLVKGNAVRYLGHNPLGGWSVLAMLLVVMLQAVLGLFANDDIFTEGPLFLWVSKAASDRLTRIHRLNQYVIMGLTAIHILAVAYHFFIERENLLKPMFTGTKPRSGDDTAPAPAPNWLAAVIVILTGCVVYLIVY
ncbi:MAG: cytochrome b/b6 domain-containing protein [Deltaproteobacteria bacterium]|jgi:cytochrome b|nr:cytochrome b/b6 domain-containing protein [Deltaproteobacteria bacterium]